MSIASQFFDIEDYDNKFDVSAFTGVLSEAKRVVRFQIKEIESTIEGTTMTWNGGSTLFQNHHAGRKQGIYCLIYKSTNEVMYIGNGVLSQRITRMRNIWSNNGQIIYHDGGGSSDHIGARKAFEMDSDENNWIIRWCQVEERMMREQIEIELVNRVDPPFNQKGMAGK